MSYEMPKDPHMLVSYMNMMLRDRYSSFEEFCDDNNTDPKAVLEKVSAAGYEYIEEINQFR